MPPSFQFQNILEIRHREVEAIEIQMGNLQTELKKLEEHINSLKGLEQNLLSEMKKSMEGEIDLFRLDVLRSNFKMVRASIARTENEIDLKQIDISRTRMKLVEAKQAEETLEILKKKGFDRFTAEQALKESRQQDDIYISLAYRLRQQGVNR